MNVLTVQYIIDVIKNLDILHRRTRFLSENRTTISMIPPLNYSFCLRKKKVVCVCVCVCVEIDKQKMRETKRKM